MFQLSQCNYIKSQAFDFPIKSISKYNVLCETICLAKELSSGYGYRRSLLLVIVKAAQPGRPVFFDQVSILHPQAAPVAVKDGDVD